MLVAMWLVARSTPGLSIDIPARRLVAALSAIVGAVVAIPAVVSFRSAETTVDPREPGKASRLVVTGVYRFSRNPMYLGLLCLLFGWATWLSNVPAFLGLLVFVLFMNRLQIQPEERAMAAQFGEEYRASMNSVRRWI